MTCPKCSGVVPEDASFCPYCGADVAPAATLSPTVPPPPPQTPRAPAPPPRAQPVAVPAPPRRSSPVLAIVLIGCLGLLILLGGGGFLAWKKFAPALADMPESKAEPTQAADNGTSSAGEAKEAAPQPAPEAPSGFSLDDFVGKWEFVGEPGPWGEGMPFTLKRVGNLMVGEVEIDPMYDDQIALKLAAGNEELIGESTTTWKDGRSEVHSISMTLNEAKNIITLKFRADDGEWIVRVAQKKSGGQ